MYTDCRGAINETRHCPTGQVCPIHGQFREWSEWFKCTATCGGGEGRRTRTCIKPKFGGRPCEGETKEKGPCNTQTCPPPTIAPGMYYSDGNCAGLEKINLSQEYHHNFPPLWDVWLIHMHFCPKFICFQYSVALFPLFLPPLCDIDGLDHPGYFVNKRDGSCDVI